MIMIVMIIMIIIIIIIIMQDVNNKSIIICIIYRASDISRKKKQNFAGFSGANSRKNRPISWDFRGKKVKIRGTIGRFRGIFAGEKSKFAEKASDFAGNFGEKLRQETISKKQPISLRFFGKFR